MRYPALALAALLVTGCQSKPEKTAVAAPASADSGTPNTTGAAPTPGPVGGLGSDMSGINTSTDGRDGLSPGTDNAGNASLGHEGTRGGNVGGSGHGSAGSVSSSVGTGTVKGAARNAANETSRTTASETSDQGTGSQAAGSGMGNTSGNTVPAGMQSTNGNATGK